MDLGNPWGVFRNNGNGIVHLFLYLKYLLFIIFISCISGQSEAIVRYDLYRGNNRYIPQPVTPPSYNNGEADFNTNFVLYTNNLISFTKTPANIAASGTSSQADYYNTDYLMCDQVSYNSGIVASRPSCLNGIAGYEGYTAILLPKAGKYTFRVTGNDSMQIDVINPFPATQTRATNIDYKNLSYTTTTGPLRSGGTFLTVTVIQPTYVMMRMYWDNWGNDAEYHLQWQTPENSNWNTIPSTYTCDPAAPAQDCFPDISIKKSAPTYVKPSIEASSNPVVAATANYLSPYTLTVNVAASATGNTQTFGTTTVQDILPDSLTWIDGISSISSPAGWNCGVSGKVITCTNPNVLTAPSTYSIQILNLLVGNSLNVGTQINNTATVQNDNESTGTTANNTDTAITKTIMTKLTKSVKNLSTGENPSATATPGNQLQYCILAENNGGADLANYTITDPISEHLKDITSITLVVDGNNVAGSAYNSGVVSSASFLLKSLSSAQLCFNATVV